MAKYKKQEGNGIVLCKIGERDYTDSYFFGYVATNQTRSNKTLSNAVKDIYEAFIEQINLDYEEGLLEEKYEAFKNIMQEYKDGILLFELTSNCYFGFAKSYISTKFICRNIGWQSVSTVCMEHSRKYNGMKYKVVLARSKTC